jgi:hypothetical protein
MNDSGTNHVMSDRERTQRELVRLRQVALCEALGLDPATVTSVAVDFQAGRTVVTWAGMRKLTREETAACLEAIARVVVKPDDDG